MQESWVKVREDNGKTATRRVEWGSKVRRPRSRFLGIEPGEQSNKTQAQSCVQGHLFRVGDFWTGFADVLQFPEGCPLLARGTVRNWAGPGEWCSPVKNWSSAGALGVVTHPVLTLSH